MLASALIRYLPDAPARGLRPFRWASRAVPAPPAAAASAAWLPLASRPLLPLQLRPGIQHYALGSSYDGQRHALLTLSVLRNLWWLLFLWSLWARAAHPQIHRKSYRRALYRNKYIGGRHNSLYPCDESPLPLPKSHGSLPKSHTSASQGSDSERTLPLPKSHGAVSAGA